MTHTRINRLGSGNFGEVWLERDDALGRLCASKYVAAATGIAMFAEAQAMLAAEHPNVVQIYSADEVTGGFAVIRMQLLAKGSTEDMYGGRPAPVGAALRHVEDACRGIEHLHANGMLHRDVKPANLLLADDLTVKVSDFGLACPISTGGAGVPIGYKAHLPPEDIIGTGHITSISGDVYATGVTLHRLLCGDAHLLALRNTGADIEAEVVAGRYPDRSAFGPHVHDRLRRVVRRAIHADVTKRFERAADLRHALEKVRPVVSWTPVPVSQGLAWDGTASDGGSEYQARLEPTGNGWQFWIEKRLAGRGFRRLHTLGITGCTLKVATRHTETVLDDIADPR